ncbi:hypothetical protein ACFL45_10400 [Candidatus Neomarinimicrobiota bacterium]
MKLRTFISPIKVLLLLMATFALWSCEVETTGEPRANILPETYISEISPGVNTRVSWYGTDVDGRVETFEYNWDGGTWVETANLSEVFPVDDPTNPYAEFAFSDLDDSRVFSVRAIDDRDGTDPYAATATTSPNTIRPETQILEGPMTGEIVGPDVHFVWDGVDNDGTIDGFEWALDDVTDWTAVEEYVTEQLFLGLATGPHTFYVRAVDNFGAVDGSPAQSAFVTSSAVKPKIVNLGTIQDEGAAFSGVAIGFEWIADVDWYKGVLPTGAYSYALDDDTNFDGTAAPLASGWSTATTMDLTAAENVSGDHAFFIKARDASGNVDTMRVRYEAAPFAPTKDLLLLDNFSWQPSSYATIDEVNEKIATGFLNGVTYDVIDLDAAGTGDLTPAVLGQYSSVVLVTDGGYNSADFAALFVAYGQAGGNLLITGYWLADLGSDLLYAFGMDGPYGTGSYLMEACTGVATGGYLETADLEMPVPAADAPRICERVYTDWATTEAIFYNSLNVEDLNPSYAAARAVGVISEVNDGANYVIIFGQAVPFWDQDHADTKAFGDRLMALWGVTDTDNP